MGVKMRGRAARSAHRPHAPGVAGSNPAPATTQREDRMSYKQILQDLREEIRCIREIAEKIREKCR